MKKLEVASLSLDSKIKTLEHIFDNMHVRSSGMGQAGYLLGGDTGVGKTSFVRDMASLLGLQLIIIETPHIVEEHLIDIPFIVIKNGSAKSDRVVVDTKSSHHEFDIKFAKSHLHTALTAATKTGDETLLDMVNARADLRMIWEKLGGTDEKIPAEIADIRAKFDVILFLDEYFRQTSTSIRNMLRSILNGRIGTNDLPENVYTIFASNLIDQGVGDILENEDFRLLNFDTPDLDGWFAYIMAKYKGKMHDGLISSFYELLKKNKGSLSINDIDSDVRVSPRRWEQLLVYINANLPVKTSADADALLKNVEINFRNYTDGSKAAIAQDVLKTVKQLLKDEYSITGDHDNVDDSDWRDTLRHQLATRIKAGNNRKYIPVIAGLPGAGKTKYIAQVAADLNLVPIIIDVQNLSPEEIIGTPLANTSDGEISVNFSRPALYDYVEGEIKKGTKHLEQRLLKFHGDTAGAKKFAEWSSGTSKYLIFFDELNRTSVKVFNAIRKVILEKEFNDDYKLPKEALIVAAINPTGKGVVELTKHVRDVFDVIPVGISFTKWKQHIESPEFAEGLSFIKPPEGIEIAKNALLAFIDHFKVKDSSKINGADSHFYISIGESPIYISPREYTDLFVGSAKQAARAYSKEMVLLGDPDHDAGESEERVRRAIAESYKHSLEHIISNKNGIDVPGFYSDLEEWFAYTDKYSLGSMFKRKVKSVLKLSDLLARSFENHDEHLFNEQEFINYVTTVDPIEFQEQFLEFLQTTVVADMKNSFAPFGKKKVLDKAGKLSVVQKEVSKLEYIVREILHALVLHDVSNKMLESLRQSMQQALVKLAEHDDDYIEQVLGLAREIKTYINGLV